MSETGKRLAEIVKNGNYPILEALLRDEQHPPPPRTPPSREYCQVDQPAEFDFNLLGKHLSVENVTDRIGRHILASTVRPATELDIENAINLHIQGNCPHTVVQDTAGWMYDFRSCAICGKGLGTV